MTINKPDTTHSGLTLLDAAGAIGFVVYSASMVLTPIVLLRLADELGFGLAQGGGIEAVRAGFLLAVLLVSGAAAARFGRTRSLSVGAAILAGGACLLGRPCCHGACRSWWWRAGGTD
jgi:hypothetical protein